MLKWLSLALISGILTLAVKPKPDPKWIVIGLKSVTLKPVE